MEICLQVLLGRTVLDCFSGVHLPFAPHCYMFTVMANDRLSEWGEKCRRGGCRVIIERRGKWK